MDFDYKEAHRIFDMYKIIDGIYDDLRYAAEEPGMGFVIENPMVMAILLDYLDEAKAANV